MAGVNLRLATIISEAEILKIQEDEYQKTQRRPQKVLLRSLSEYILKLIFTELCGSVKILLLFTSISKSNC